MFIFAILIPKLLKVSKSDIGVHRFMLMFSNTGFLGLPVIYALWGSEGVFNAIIFNLPYYTLMFTIGVHFITNGKNNKFNYKIFITPPIIANIVGLLLFTLNLNMPEVITLSLSNIGSLTTPLALIIIGVSLASVNIRNTFTTYIYYIYCFLKLLIIPFLVFILLRSFGIEGTTLGVIVVLSGMPIPSNGVILAKQYGANELLASEGVFISTLLSFLTIPFIAYGLSYFM
jgi:predicted permease